MLATEINPLSLPSVTLEQRSQLPTTPCIYFAIDSAGVVQYIGRSANLRQRWISHHRYAELKSMDSVNIAWLEVSEPAMLLEIEVALVQWFKPALNGSKTTGKKVVVAHMNGELVRQIRVLAAMEGHSVSSYLESLAKREVEQARKKGVRFDLLSGSKNA